FHTVMAKVNSGEDHFAITAIDEAADFVENMCDRAAGEMRADMGDDAEAAVEQAAVLHFDIGALAVGIGADAGGQINDAEAAQEVRKFALVGDHFGDTW